MPAPDPKLIFKTADIFSETAATILHKAWGEEKTYLQFAFGVNAALATELYLKCLLLIECGQFPRVHDLKRLFSQLRRGTQQRLRKMHDQANREDPNLVTLQRHGVIGKSDLHTLLEKGKDVFEQFRYPYEPRSKDVLFGLSGLALCARQYILSLHPEWANDESTSQDH